MSVWGVAIPSAGHMRAKCKEAEEDALMYILCCQVVNITVRDPEHKHIIGGKLRDKAGSHQGLAQERTYGGQHTHGASDHHER